MNSKCVSFFKYFYAAVSQNISPRKMVRFLKDGLKAASDDFFYIKYDPFFKIINWEEIANKYGTTINCIPAGPEGMFLTYQNICIACLVKWISPKTILEIGTYEGRTTRTLFLNSGNDTEIYTVDLPPHYVLEKNTTDKLLAEQSIRSTKKRYLPESSRVHQILSDSTKLDFGKIANGKKFDLVVIDGSHSMFHASRDTKSALEVLSDQGAIVWDDASYRSYMWYKEDFRVHESIRSVLPKPQQHVYRMSGTVLAVYWQRLTEMILKL